MRGSGGAAGCKGHGSLGREPMQICDGCMNFETRRRELGIQLLFTLAGGVLLAAGAAHRYLMGGGEEIAGIAYASGGLLLAIPVLRKGLLALMGRGTDTNVLVAIAVAAALALGDYLSAGMVSFFMIIGGLMEEHTALGARAAIELLLRLTPAKAVLKKDDGSEEEMAASALKRGQRVVVRPGAAIPCDGRVAKGRSAVDQSGITGESVPVEVAPGSMVFAGTLNLTGALEVEVEKAGEDTTMGRVQAMVMAAQSTRPAVHRLVDAYARYYTPMVVALAAAVLYFSREPRHAIATLIVGCPCALVIATPIATVAALARAARWGVLVRSARQLETASRVNAVVLDKTGTLTTGHLVPVRFETAPGASADELLACAASALRYSSHPVARAALEAARGKSLPLEDPEETIEISGMGVRAVFAGRGGEKYEILAGRREFAGAGETASAAAVRSGSAAGTEGPAGISGHENGSAAGIPAGAPPAPAAGGGSGGTGDPHGGSEAPAAAADADGATLLYVSRGGSPMGAIYFEDRARPDSAEAVRAMRRMRVKSVHMLTGDKRGTAERVGRALGVDEVAAELMPEQKVSFVESLKSKGRVVAFVGDGINDAPALAAAHLGIAVGGAGNEVAMRTADVVLTSGDISKVPLLLDLAGTTRRVIGQNVTLAIGVGLVALVLAAAGWLPPVAASLVHNGAAAFVIANATRILRAKTL